MSCSGFPCAALLVIGTMLWGGDTGALLLHQSNLGFRVHLGAANGLWLVTVIQTAFKIWYKIFIAFSRVLQACGLDINLCGQNSHWRGGLLHRLPFTTLPPCCIPNKQFLRIKGCSPKPHLKLVGRPEFRFHEKLWLKQSTFYCCNAWIHSRCHKLSSALLRSDFFPGFGHNPWFLCTGYCRQLLLLRKRPLTLKWAWPAASLNFIREKLLKSLLRLVKGIRRREVCVMFVSLTFQSVQQAPPILKRTRLWNALPREFGLVLFSFPFRRTRWSCWGTFLTLPDSS